MRIPSASSWTLNLHVVASLNIYWHQYRLWVCVSSCLLLSSCLSLSFFSLSFSLCNSSSLLCTSSTCRRSEHDVSRSLRHISFHYRAETCSTFKFNEQETYIPERIVESGRSFTDLLFCLCVSMCLSVYLFSISTVCVNSSFLCCVSLCSCSLSFSRCFSWNCKAAFSSLSRRRDSSAPCHTHAHTDQYLHDVWAAVWRIPFLCDLPAVLYIAPAGRSLS